MRKINFVRISTSYLENGNRLQKAVLEGLYYRSNTPLVGFCGILVIIELYLRAIIINIE